MAIRVSNITVIDDSRKLANYRLTNVSINTNTTAATGNHYILTANLTLTLPPAPTPGDLVGISNLSGVLTCVIGRNGQNIQGLAENMTIDLANAAFALQYSGATLGWVFA